MALRRVQVTDFRCLHRADLDFDPISSGNDPNFHDLRITVESEQAARAVVIADFVSDQDKCAHRAALSSGARE